MEMNKILPAKLEGEPGRSFDYQIVFADGRRILAGDAIYHSPEFAEFIVRAVNAHQALVDALEAFIWDAYLEETEAVLCGWCGMRTAIGEGHFHGGACRVQAAESALSLARGESADPKAVRP